jgi:ribosomal protein L5
LGFLSLVGMQCPFSGAGEPTFGLDSWRTFRDPEVDYEMNLEGRGMEAMMAISSS